jgi:hypothetical protein
MKLQFQPPALGAQRRLPPWCAFLGPKPPARFLYRLKISPQPHANYNQTNPASASVNSSTCSGSPSPNPKTIENT